MVAVGRHSGLGHTLAIALVSLHVVLVGHGLLGVHGHIWGHTISGRDVLVLGHARTAALWRKMLRCRLFGGFRAFEVAAVVASRIGFRGVETCLSRDKHVSENTV